MSEETIRVAVAGAAGRMGREVCRAILAAADLLLAGAVDPAAAGQTLGPLIGDAECNLVIAGDLADSLIASSAQVMVDFTLPDARIRNFRAAIDAGVRPVVGTTGWTAQDLEMARRWCEEHGLGAVIAPNFAIGAVLMMKFAAEAARYLPAAEIIELHHDRKVDAPSGTAILTAQTLHAARSQAPAIPGGGPARGEVHFQVPVHSVRLPGLVAHQEVIFGGLGQSLIIRHDSYSRESFMPGVLLACRKVVGLDRLVYGLEQLL